MINKAIDKIKIVFNKIKQNDRRIILVVIIVVIILLMMDFNNRMVVLMKLNEQRDQLSTQVIQFEQTKQSFQEQLVYANSDQALEEWAREKARMVEEGDIPIIIIPPGGQQSTATPHPISTPEPVANWEVWSALFFGE